VSGACSVVGGGVLPGEARRSRAEVVVVGVPTTGLPLPRDVFGPGVGGLLTGLAPKWVVLNATVQITWLGRVSLPAKLKLITCARPWSQVPSVRSNHRWLSPLHRSGVDVGRYRMLND